MPKHLLRHSLFAAAFLLGADVTAEAMPIATGLDGATTITQAQYSPGYHARRQYRRALRRYRNHPGAQFELRQNRRIYCRNTPERC